MVKWLTSVVCVCVSCSSCSCGVVAQSNDWVGVGEGGGQMCPYGVLSLVVCCVGVARRTTCRNHNPFCLARIPPPCPEFCTEFCPDSEYVGELTQGHMSMELLRCVSAPSRALARALAPAPAPEIGSISAENERRQRAAPRPLAPGSAQQRPLAHQALLTERTANCELQTAGKIIQSTPPDKFTALDSTRRRSCSSAPHPCVRVPPSASQREVHACRDSLQITTAMTIMLERLRHAASIAAAMARRPPGSLRPAPAEPLRRYRAHFRPIADLAGDSGSGWSSGVVQQQWAPLVGALPDYVEECGHGWVRRGYVTADGYAMGADAEKARLFARRERLAVADRAALIDAGFEWDYGDHRWDRATAALQTYSDEHGHLRVSTGFVVPAKAPWPKACRGMLLGETVHNIRSKHLFVKDKPERREWLDSMGFVWTSMRVGGPRKGKPERCEWLGSDTGKPTVGSYASRK